MPQCSLQVHHPDALVPEAKLSDRLLVLQPGSLHSAILSYQVTWKLHMHTTHGAKKYNWIMPALCSMLWRVNYAWNYAGIIFAPLLPNCFWTSTNSIEILGCEVFTIEAIWSSVLVVRHLYKLSYTRTTPSVGTPILVTTSQWSASLCTLVKESSLWQQPKVNTDCFGPKSYVL